MTSLLEVRGLTVELPTAEGSIRPVNEVSLRIGAGEALGMVGESGSGKTMLALALMGLLPPGARVSGEASLKEGEEEKDAKEVKEKRGSERAGRGKNLVTLSEQQWRAVRGREIAMIFQEPMTALNPVMRLGAQIEEAIRAHYPAMTAEQVRRWMMEALRLASVPEPETRAEQYPHQLSGGLRQRVMIAMAIAAGVADSSLENGAGREAAFIKADEAPSPTVVSSPASGARYARPAFDKRSAASRLLIADEPTTALDVTVQKQILELLGRLRRELGLGLLFITHDLGVVAQVAERVVVMYAGRVVEEGPVREVLRAPRHPYTQGLLAASPRLERGKLTPIPGTVPQLTALPPGCAFEPRCGLRRAECTRAVPDLRAASSEHAARCVLV